VRARTRFAVTGDPMTNFDIAGYSATGKPSAPRFSSDSSHAYFCAKWPTTATLSPAGTVIVLSGNVRVSRSDRKAAYWMSFRRKRSMQ
jgi:hypothetical protein